MQKTNNSRLFVVSIQLTFRAFSSSGALQFKHLHKKLLLLLHANVLLATHKRSILKYKRIKVQSACFNIADVITWTV